ncbi:MAG TPA: S-methyl-5-thioribose-1-phosphate isomerase, partial [Burkholderiales bacterium]|nr:S-methyl-5-thioribose-1-phosphate isomerase [Burkholderiales bacterium]
MRIVVDGRAQDRRALWWESNALSILDQRLLPERVSILSLRNVESVASAITDMAVRGAPAIGAAAAYGMVLGRLRPDESAAILKATRPTAVNLAHAVDTMQDALVHHRDPLASAHAYTEQIVDACRRIGVAGLPLVPDGTRVLTHCNAGALATVDFGTATAPMRAAHAAGRKLTVYCDETRPRLQGVLTAWELSNEGIDARLIADNAAGYLLSKGRIDVAIVGADRIASNGDVANKIGTYEKAVVARENDVPFYVAAPVST